MEKDLNLCHNNSEIRWEYMGQALEYFIDGIEFASVEEGYIYVEAYKNPGFSYFYISFDHKKVICYDSTQNLILINNTPAILFEEKPLDVSMGNDWNIYVLLNEYNMILYNEDGTYIRSVPSPNGYNYCRFFSAEDTIRVVCQGHTVCADPYGRNDWKFIYKDNGWVKEGIVY